MEYDYIANTVFNPCCVYVVEFILNKIIYKFPFICNDITFKTSWHT